MVQKDSHTIRINDVKYFNLLNFYVDHNLWFWVLLYFLGAQFELLGWGLCRASTRWDTCLHW